jgi:hypothetical protein
VSALRLIADVIELDGRPIAKLLPELRLSIRDHLIAIFDDLGEDEATIVELEGRVAKLEARLKVLQRPAGRPT